MYSQEESMSKFAIISTFNDPNSKMKKYEQFDAQMGNIATELKDQFAAIFGENGRIDASRIWPLSL